MKTINLLSIAVGLFAIQVSMAQNKYVPEDDLYRKRGAENRIVSEKKSQWEQQFTTESSQPKSVLVTTNGDISVDEYNRRIYNEEVDVLYQEDEGSDSITEFNGSMSDFEYSERVRKFHNPKYSVHISDPDYVNVYLLNSSDWTVYVDGNYATIAPTWTNPYYGNDMWSPYSYSSYYWRNNAWGSSWGWGYNSWYGGCDPYWGHYRPNYWWGGHHHHHYPSYGYYPSSRTYSSNGRSSGYRSGGGSAYGNSGRSSGRSTYYSNGSSDKSRPSSSGYVRSSGGRSSSNSNNSSSSNSVQSPSSSGKSSRTTYFGNSTNNSNSNNYRPSSTTNKESNTSRSTVSTGRSSKSSSSSSSYTPSSSGSSGRSSSGGSSNSSGGGGGGRSSGGRR